MIEVLKRY